VLCTNSHNKLLKRTKNSWLFAPSSLILANNFSPLSKTLVCKGYSCLVFSSILVVSIFSVQAKNKCDISGVWDHSAKPAKLLVNLNEAEVTVYSHDNNPKAVGLAVLEALKPTSNSLLWNAQMYSSAEDSFVDVQIALKSCNQLTVSFDGEEVLELVR